MPGHRHDLLLRQLSVAELRHPPMTAGIERHVCRKTDSAARLPYQIRGVDFRIGSGRPAFSRRDNDRRSKTRQGREVGFNVWEELLAAIFEGKPRLLARLVMLQAHEIGAARRAHIAPA